MSSANVARTSNPARTTERQLLGLALVVVVGAYAVAALAAAGNLSTGALLYSGALIALAAIAHLAVRRLAPFADPVLLPTAFLLNGLGLVLVRRIDFAQGTRLAGAQTTWTVVGIGLFALTLLLVDDHRRLARFRYTAGAATLALLLLPMVPGIGQVVNGARLWVDLGLLSFQPGELAKLTMVVFLAGYLEDKRALLSVATTRAGPLLLPAPRHLAPVLVAALGGVGILVVQRDLGSSLLFFGVFVAMLYIATGRAAYPAIGLTAFLVGGATAYAAFSHVQLRFTIWLRPFDERLINDESYQLVQSLFALGTGGLTGTGLGLGRPQIPAAATDAIFAVLGEELGLLGATATLLAFLLVVTRGYKTALIAADEVGTLLAAGLSTILALQVFVIVGGVTRLVPLTGITLPFVSYGGSSLIANYLLLALLLRISDGAHRSARFGPAGTGRS
ncbi:MAG TPA: FtsW/RodA/SpoVE family cell cycle protein [Nitriliruptorales bacterium]|nr:FtsW/RodA/SpoVE family cell cycle protein [Nitriliruptorales bacterium]